MTRIDAGLIANDLLNLLVGYAILYAFGLSRLRRGDVRLLGLAYLSGWAALGIALTFALIAGVPPRVATAVVLAVAIAAGCVLVGARRDPVAPPRPRPAPSSHPLAIAAVVLAAAILAVAAVSALALSLQGTAYADYWDAFLFWLPKTQSIYYLGGLDADVWRTITHPEYPPLLPATDAATFHFVGGFHPSLLPFQRTLLGLSFLLSALALLDRFTPRWVSLPTLALLATTPWFWWRLQTPLGDQPLAYLVTAAALALVIWLYEPRLHWILLALLLLTAGTLTKLEGSLFASSLIAVVIVTGFALHRRAALPTLLLLLAPATILPWKVWLGAHDLPTSAADYHLTDMLRPGFLADRTIRLHSALEWMVRSPFDDAPTALMVCASILVLVVLALRLPAIVAAVAAWLVLSISGLATIYWIGRMPINWYLGTSVARVGTTVILAGITVTTLLIGLALQRRPGEGEMGAEPAAPG